MESVTIFSRLWSRFRFYPLGVISRQAAVQEAMGGCTLAFVSHGEGIQVYPKLDTVK